jgi:hypothetical protein
MAVADAFLANSKTVRTRFPGSGYRQQFDRRQNVKQKLLALLMVAAAAQVGAQVTDAMIANDAATPDNVLSWGLGTQGQRHSTLNGVNTQDHEAGAGVVHVVRW